jgi:hypothetical protein
MTVHDRSSERFDRWVISADVTALRCGVLEQQLHQYDCPNANRMSKTGADGVSMAPFSAGKKHLHVTITNVGGCSIVMAAVFIVLVAAPQTLAPRVAS